MRTLVERWPSVCSMSCADAVGGHLDVEPRAVTFEKGGFRPHGSQTVAEHPASSVGPRASSERPPAASLARTRAWRNGRRAGFRIR